MAYLLFWFTVKARKSYLGRYDFLAYMQVTAAFPRKSYLHLISLITLLLISISTWNLSQNLSLDLFHHNNERKLLLHLMIFRRSVFLCLKFTFDSNFGMFIVLKKKQTLQSEEVDIHKQYKYCWNSWNNQQRRYSIISVAYLHFWFTMKLKKVVSAQIRLSCLHARNSCFCKKVVSASN